MPPGLPKAPGLSVRLPDPWRPTVTQSWSTPSRCVATGPAFLRCLRRVTGRARTPRRVLGAARSPAPPDRGRRCTTAPSLAPPPPASLTPDPTKADRPWAGTSPQREAGRRRSGHAHRDLPGPRFGALRQRHDQNAVLVLGEDPLGVDARGEREAAGERAVGALDPVVLVALRLEQDLALALDDEDVSGQIDIDAITLEAGQLAAHDDRVRRLDHVGDGAPASDPRLLA